MSRPVQYKSKTDLVAEALRGMIEAGECEPGMSLRQREVADMFGVSATPVREAFRRLEGEGFLAIEPHRASVVIRSADARLYENALVRAALESLGAELAAEKITARQVDDLRTINARMDVGRPHQELLDINREFHFGIYEITESPVLLAQINLLWRMLGSGPHVQRDVSESISQHEGILDALADGNAELAAQRTRSHILEAHKALVAVRPPDSSIRR